MMSEKVLLHQVHPAKLAADISASIISNALLWQHQLKAGILTRFLLPIAGSALVLSFADVSRLRSRPAGRYVLTQMTPTAMAVRLAGDALMALGAWYRRPAWMFTGLLVVGAGWSRGLIRLRP